jgi:hypothetical protein
VSKKVLHTQGWATPDYSYERWAFFMLCANFFFGACHLTFALGSLGKSPVVLSAIYLSLSLLFSFNGTINLDRYLEARRDRLRFEAEQEAFKNALKVLTSN